ncbi:hypothetical protein BKA62DRAFT_691758 [Auriculariales sp. MPI-PUGE-AT-0066]|nr:hypothetical protein BKA62DRAFT_691758 [Auriculariales sp. MPI-PUGE-AT-0066]
MNDSSHRSAASYEEELAVLSASSSQQYLVVESTRQAELGAYIEEFENVWQSDIPHVSRREAQRQRERRLEELETQRETIDQRADAELSVLNQQNANDCERLDGQFGLKKGTTLRKLRAMLEWQRSTMHRGPHANEQDLDDEPFDGYGDEYTGGPKPPHMSANKQDIVLVQARQRYEAAWATLSSIASSRLLRWYDIPWPLLSPPSRVEQLTREEVEKFFSLNDRRDLREALLRWHPDRFDGRWLASCGEADRPVIRDGVGLVARCLNGLLDATS